MKRRRIRRKVICICMSCYGTGDGGKCKACGGTGEVEKYITEEVSE